MKVRMLLPIGGSVDGVRYPRAGEEFEVADAAGVKLCEKGLAEPVSGRQKAEAAEPAAKRETRKK